MRISQFARPVAWIFGIFAVEWTLVYAAYFSGNFRFFFPQLGAIARGVITEQSFFMLAYTFFTTAVTICFLLIGRAIWRWQKRRKQGGA